MIEHDDGAAAWFQHAMDLINRLLRFRRVMQYAMRVDDIKTLIRKLQFLGVRRLKRSREPVQLKTLACQFYGCVREIDSGVIGARLRKLSAVSPKSATNLKNLESAGSRKFGRFGNVPFLRIAVRLNQFIKVARARRRLGKLYPARIPLPVSSDSLLKICICVSHRKAEQDNRMIHEVTRRPGIGGLSDESGGSFFSFPSSQTGKLLICLARSTTFAVPRAIEIMVERRTQNPVSKPERPVPTAGLCTDRPDVIVEFLFDRGLLYISINNIGKLPAIDVSVKFNKKIVGLGGTKEISALAVFRNLKFLGPGREIAILLDSSSSYFKRKQATKISASVAYRDEQKRSYEKKINHDLEIYRELPFVGQP